MTVTIAPRVDTSEYSNSELEEMGIDPEHDCIAFYREVDRENIAWDVCADCGAAVRLGPWHG
jgi:hypothetical protein